MRVLKSIAGILAAMMFMLSAVSGLGFAEDIVITDDEIDFETGLAFKMLDNGTYSVKCPDINCDKLTGELVIPNEYKGQAVTEIAEYGFVYCENITSIRISEGIRNVGGAAFAGCFSLKEIYIPKTVQNVDYGLFGFQGCPALTDVNIAEDHELYCSIDGVVFSKDKTSLVFYPNKPEEHYTIPDFVTTLTEYAFSNCDNLISITVSNNITEIGDCVFDSCPNLEIINIPASVSNIDAGCVRHVNNFQAFVVDEHNQNYCAVDGVLFSKDMTQLLLYPWCKTDKEYRVPDGVTSLAELGSKYMNTLILPKDLEQICDIYIFGNDPMELKCDDCEIIYEGTLNEWKELSTDLYFPNYTITCSDGVILAKYLQAAAKDPVSVENVDNSVSYNAGITQDVADSTNRLSAFEIKEIKSVIENVSVDAPADAGLDTSINLYVTPNVPIKESFNSRSMSLDITFKNAFGDEVQPQRPVRVKIPVPERFKNISPIYVYHINDDGRTEKIEAIIATEGDIEYIVFETDRFSVYVLTDSLINVNTTPETSDSGNMDTDDTNSGSTSNPNLDENNSKEEQPNDTSSDTSSKLFKTARYDKDAPRAEIKTPNGTLAEAVLNSDELEHYKNGLDIGIILDVKNAQNTVTEADKHAAEFALDKLSGYNIGQYFDLRLFKKINGSEKQVYGTASSVTVSIEIPQNLCKNGREYIVICVHNGSADILNDYDENENTVTIHTDKFSTYALAYHDKATVSTSPNENGTNNPYTGTNTGFATYLIVGIASLFIFIILCLFTGKNGMSEERKERAFYKLIAWGKKGGRVHAAIALVLVFVLLSFYYSIGTKTPEK